MFGKTCYIALAAVITFSLVVVIVAAAQAYYVEYQAKQLLGVLKRVNVGSTSQADVLKMTDRFGRYRQYGPPELGFTMYNSWATRLKLAPPSGFWVTIGIKNGVVVTKSATEWSGAASPVAAASVRESARGFDYMDKVRSSESEHPSRTVQWEEHAPNTAPGKVRRILIAEDNTSPESQRRDDWDFDLSCMSQLLRGCWDARTMLPNATPTPLPNGNPASAR